MSALFAGGFDVGATWIRAICFDVRAGRIVRAGRCATPPDPAVGVAAIGRAWHFAGSPAIAGVASAALTDAAGLVTSWPNRPAYVGTKLFKMFEGAVPYSVDDGSAAAFAEHHAADYGEGLSVYVAVGTGIGGGVVVNGRLLRGRHGDAMNIGHIAVPSGAGVLCRCGETGCVQAIASGRALVTGSRERAVAGLAELVQILHRVFDGNAFVFGGGVCSDEPFVDAIADRVRAMHVPGAVSRGRFGDLASAVGAAGLAVAADSAWFRCVLATLASAGEPLNIETVALTD